jgi:DNA end-binding protein Ku
VSFRQLHRKDLSPIKYERVCQAEGKPVPWGEIVKGYEYEKDKFVVITDEDLKAVAIEGTKTIEVLDFVRAAEVDPRFFETPYYLLPSGKGAEKAYALLREAIRASEMIGVGKITMRSNSHHLCGVKVVGDALVLELMRFAQEVVDTDAFSFPDASLVRPQELVMAKQLVENLSEPFSPEKYRDEYRDALMSLITAKMKGKKVKHVAAEEPEGTNVVDLMARLQESLAQGKRRKPAAAAPTRTRRAAAKKRKSA